SLDKIPKKAFLLRGTAVEIIESLPEKQRGKVAMWILKYGITGQCEEYEKEYLPVLRPIFSDIDVEKRRYENKEFINRKINYIESSIKYRNLDKEKQELLEQVIKGLKKIYVDVRSHDVLNLEEKIVDKFSLPVAVLFNLVDSQVYREMYEKQEKPVEKKTQIIDNRYMARRGGH
ncbi:MAG: DUF6291 domain-containing protein, partial [Oscillospiraceae bacterium]